MTMEHFTCEDISAVLSGLLDGELEADVRHRAEVHLAQCDSCRALVSEAEDMDRDLHQAIASREAWSTDFEKRVWNEIRDPDEGRLQIRRYRIAAWTGWLSAAAATIIAGVVFFGPSQNVIQPAGDQNDRIALNGNGEDRESDRISPVVIGSNGDRNDPSDEGSLAPDVADDGPMIEQDDLESESRYAASDSTVYTNGPIWIGPPADFEYAALANPDALDSEMAMARNDEPVLEDETEAVRNAFVAQNAADVESDDESPSDDQFNPIPRSVPHPDLVAMNLDDNTMTDDSDRVQDSTDQKEIEGDWQFDTDDVLYQTSVLIDLLERADEDSFADLYQINQIIEYDGVLERLARIRGEVDGDTAMLVERAWAALEWVNGPVDQEQLRTIKRLIAEDQMPQRLETMSNRYASQ